MPTSSFSFVLLLCTGIAGAGAALAQSAPAAPADPELPSVLAGQPGTLGAAPRLNRLNAGLTLISVHDSADGWYTVATPALAYSFGRRYSADLSIPIYLYRLSESEVTTTGAATGPGQPPGTTASTTQLRPHEFDPGDVLLGVHAYFFHGRSGNTLSGSVTLPSGDVNDGLSTGHVTFDLSAHSQLDLSRAALVLDLGGGDSSTLVDPLVTRDYTSLGPLAHFQAGVQLRLPFRSLFQTLAYEQLPLGDDKIYTTLRRPGFPGQTVYSGRSVSEDNGFANSLSIPLSPRVALHGYYNRSLRLHLDTAGVGLSFALRPAAPR